MKIKRLIFPNGDVIAYPDGVIMDHLEFHDVEMVCKTHGISVVATPEPADDEVAQ